MGQEALWCIIYSPEIKRESQRGCLLNINLNDISYHIQITHSCYQLFISHVNMAHLVTTKMAATERTWLLLVGVGGLRGWWMQFQCETLCIVYRCTSVLYILISNIYLSFMLFTNIPNPKEFWPATWTKLFLYSNLLRVPICAGIFNW